MHSFAGRKGRSACIGVDRRRKNQLHPGLHLPRRIRLAGDDTASGASERHSRQAELRGVEQIEELIKFDSASRHLLEAGASTATRYEPGDWRVDFLYAISLYRQPCQGFLLISYAISGIMS